MAGDILDIAAQLIETAEVASADGGT